MATFTIVLYSLGQWSEYVGHPDESLARKYSLMASYWMQVQTSLGNRPSKNRKGSLVPRPRPTHTGRVWEQKRSVW